MRRPAPATIVASLALAVAAAPAVSAADSWVQRAFYARNAGSVDGFRASKVPHAGRLVVLPRSGKLPASILPAPSRAATAPPATPGASGTAAFVANAAAAVTLAAAQTSVATLSLKPGTYAIVAKTSLHVTIDTSSPGATCQLKAGSDGDWATPDLTSSSDASIALVTTHTFAAAGAVTLTCAADDTGVIASDGHILALAFDSVTPA